jgi:hypothetical protein
MYTAWAAACALASALLLLGAYGVLLVADHGGAAPTEHAAYWPGFTVRMLPSPRPTAAEIGLEQSTADPRGGLP